jgi:peptidoglycan-associated lipoprotein
MTRTDSGYSQRNVTRVVALLPVLTLLAVTLGVSAAGGPLVAFHLDRFETDGVVLREVRVKVDGREIPVRLPAGGGAEGEPILEVPVDAGPHAVDVELKLDGHNDFFTYVNLYRFTMRGHLDLPARSGEITAVRIGVVRTAGMFLKWEDRHRLALSATSYRSDRAGPPAQDPALVAEAPPVAEARSASASACALAPVGFDFDQAALTAETRQALDQFAACLGATRQAVRVEGHCDARGGAEYNQRLGQRRADAVVKYLRERGLATVRFTSRSWGKSRPLCGEATEPCHARNRRVEAILEE